MGPLSRGPTPAASSPQQIPNVPLSLGQGQLPAAVSFLRNEQVLCGETAQGRAVAEDDQEPSDSAEALLGKASQPKSEYTPM